MKAARDASSIDVAMQIKEIAPQALEILEEIMHGDETQQSLKAKVATDIFSVLKSNGIPDLISKE